MQFGMKKNVKNNIRFSTLWSRDPLNIKKNFQPYTLIFLKTSRREENQS